MEIEQIFQQLNWVDWLVALVLLGAIVLGIQRGFLLGALDLLGIAVSLGAAIVGYRAVALLIQEQTEVPRAMAILGAFLGLIVLAGLVYTIIVNVLLRVSIPLWIALTPLYPIDRALGMIPGAIKGLTFATLLLLPFAMLPLVPAVSAGIERSAIGSRLVTTAVEAAPEAEALLGRELTEGLTFLTPPQTEEGMRIRFGPVGQLAPDPAAEAQMLELVNQERKRAGLLPLVVDEQARVVARRHSQEMFERGYFAHQSPVSGSPADRLRVGGVRYGRAGENLAYAPNVRMAHEGLMNSPGHRANILSPEFRRIGIGVIRSQFRGSMFTQNFAD